MIVLFTDFGWQGPYVGQMKAVFAERVPLIPVIDLLHDAPVYNPKAAAHLLAAYCRYFQAGTVFCAVVDPGVGSEQRSPVIVEADDHWFVGPDNGLFDVIAARASQVNRYLIQWRPDRLSDSFHGRDLFAPVAAMLAQGISVDTVAERQAHGVQAGSEKDLTEIIYIDPFGNAMTGLRANRIADASLLQVKQSRLSYARVFSDVEIGKAFWYRNSVGLIELAVNRGCAADQLGISIGDTLQVCSPSSV